MTITNPSLASSSVCEATNEILLTQSQDIATNTNSVSIIPTALKYDREKLKRSLSFHVTRLFEKALEENLDGFVNIRLFNKDLPNTKPINNFYPLKDIFSYLDQITDLAIANNKLNITILPVICSEKNAELKNLKGKNIGIGSLCLDIDDGDIEEKFNRLTDILGTPSFVVKSGGITKDGVDKIHVYYVFDSFIKGVKDVLDFFRLKKDFAILLGADENFEKPTQVVRLLGTINQKSNRLCEIKSSNTQTYNSEDLLAKVSKYIEDNKPSNILPYNTKLINNPNVGLNKNSNIRKYSKADVSIILERYDINYTIGVDGKTSYDAWRNVIFALALNFDCSDEGYQLALDWSLKDKTISEEKIKESVHEYYYKKAKNDKDRLISISSIERIAGNYYFLNELFDNPDIYGPKDNIRYLPLIYNTHYVLLNKNLVCLVQGKKPDDYHIRQLSDYIEVIGYGYTRDGNKITKLRTKNKDGSFDTKFLGDYSDSAKLKKFLNNENISFNSQDIKLIEKYLSGQSTETMPVVKFLHKGGWDEEKKRYILLYKDGIKIIDSNILNDNPPNDEKTSYLDPEFKAKYLKDGGLLGVQGTFEEWQKNVASYARGNDLMTLSLCMAFGSVFLRHFLEIRPIIMNFHGKSTGGKSTNLNVAASVFGWDGDNPEGYFKWNTTRVGLEGNCIAKNDSLLTIDELSATNNGNRGIDIATAVYDIIGGKDRTRGTASGGNRTPNTWRTLVLSSGEYTIDAILKKKGEDCPAGVVNRFVDIYAVDYKYGSFNDIHEFEDPSAFADNLVNTTNAYKGTAIIDFLEKILKDDFETVLEKVRQLKDTWINDYFKVRKNINQDQIRNIANNFALIAAGGEIAIENGVLPFEKGYALEVVGRIFNKYLSTIEDVSASVEERKIKKALIYFIQNNMNRFYIDGDHLINPNINHVGKRIIDSSGYLKELYFITRCFYEVKFGYEQNYVFKVLKDKNYILCDKDGKLSMNQYIRPFSTTIACWKINFKELGFSSMEEDTNHVIEQEKVIEYF